MQHVVIRKANSADSLRLFEIEKLCFDDPWTLEMIRGELSAKERYYYIAETDGMVAGYCGMVKVFDEGHILNVCVHPIFVRQGIGGKLLSCMIEKALEKGCDVFYLEVRESNDKAIALYKKMDFQMIGTRKGYYPNRENAVIMRKTYIDDQNKQRKVTTDL